MKTTALVAMLALSLGTSAALADVEIQSNAGKSLTTSTQSIPVGAAGSLAASPALIVVGGVVVIGGLVAILDNNSSGSH